ncbi:anti-sigma factor family protein [Alkalicoccobacillus porphyridii]|uniref:Anti-sigma factor n=1 Tax=Alkalicoccobacillus porphyridii TaxID=2597270 RepID=A0A554A2C6_9BACI|nr:anti-sigma factor [Alkalicoccobacillus porphyridii]TSB47840.1 anti-sigma factor [Alkalicoccobacillus porphyridii]
MSCESHVQGLIHKYLDGDATESEKKELYLHVETCEECGLHLRELKKVIAFTQSASHIEAPANFTNQLMMNLPPKKQSSRWKNHLRKHPILVAAAIFMLLMSTSIFSAWSGNSDKVSVSGSGNIQINKEEGIVTIPEGETIHGDLVVRNGELNVEGNVEGNVLLVNSKPYYASTGEIAGEIEEVNQALEWVWYNTKNFFAEVVSVFDSEEE